MITGASTMKNAVIEPSTATIRKKNVEARRTASARRFSSISWVKTGTNAEVIAWSATSWRRRFGTEKAIVNAEKAPLVPKKLEARTSRARPMTREAPVAIEKMAVLAARPRGLVSRDSIGPSARGVYGWPVSGAGGICEGTSAL